MEYLTNEKLLKQQQSALFSINNSRSNSVSRFPIPSSRATHDPVQPLRSADLFNRLEDILKQKQMSTTTRKRQKQISCILNSQATHEAKKHYIENSCYKSPNRIQEVPSTSGFLNVYNVEARSRKQTQPAYIGSPLINQQNQSAKKKNVIQTQFQESYLQNRKKKESLKKFQDEFNNMQEKIKIRNHSILNEQPENCGKVEKQELKENKMDINISAILNKENNNNNTINKLNQQLQLQNNHLQEQLLFEKNQNSKLNLLINNLNDQIANLNKQLNQQSQQSNEDQVNRDTQIQQLKQQIQQLDSNIQQKDNEINNYKQQIQEFNNVYKDMQELENLCQQMSYLSMQTSQQNLLILEIKELLQIQFNIIEKVTNHKDFPIEQLLIQNKKKRPQIPKQIDYQELSQETTRIMENLVKLIKASVDQLTERFIHDLLI
ncbi:unnamed protein product [Paramecium pentaurelia]|uniref:Uncharacterized protein n=1 Tax=Paramecium pentaurelia TaxID=43138 RepID=A0A8S1WZ77_9CILI|nr:unnamed protein product [Paramecium pentaurelia]